MCGIELHCKSSLSSFIAQLTFKFPAVLHSPDIRLWGGVWSLLLDSIFLQIGMCNLTFLPAALVGSR